MGVERGSGWEEWRDGEWSLVAERAGRVCERADVRGLEDALWKPGYRVLSLTGKPGTGKTTYLVSQPATLSSVLN